MLTAKHTKYAKSRFSGQAVSCSRPHRFRVVRGSCIETCNGNITYMVNSSQTLAASYRYDAFGNLLSSSGSLAGANKYRFSSKEWVEIDAAYGQAIPGIYYYGHRFYVPSLQRWPNRDPLGEEGGINLYTFIRNNSGNRFDPFGLSDDDSLSEWEQAMKELIESLKKIYDNMPDNPKECIDPCTSVTSLRAYCDCIWGAIQKIKDHPAGGRTDLINCICQASWDSQCVQKWNKRIDDIFKKK